MVKDKNATRARECREIAAEPIEKTLPTVVIFPKNRPYFGYYDCHNDCGNCAAKDCFDRRN